jgi:hypothetical protein
VEDSPEPVLGTESRKAAFPAAMQRTLVVAVPSSTRQFSAVRRRARQTSRSSGGDGVCARAHAHKATPARLEPLHQLLIFNAHDFSASKASREKRMHQHRRVRVEPQAFGQQHLCVAGAEKRQGQPVIQGNV